MEGVHPKSVEFLQVEDWVGVIEPTLHFPVVLMQEGVGAVEPTLNFPVVLMLTQRLVIPLPPLVRRPPGRRGAIMEISRTIHNLGIRHLLTGVEVAVGVTFPVETFI